MSTNLPRVTQKIFGENAGQNIGQFGSALAGQGNPTGDIEEIQALPAWEGGWNSAVISERDYPPLEEMTGIQKVETQQIAYLMQKGIPEWDAGTTYFANVSFCQIDGLVYRSLTDNNLGNNPATDTTNWEVWKPLEGTYANTDLSNLTATGEKHFVNKTQLTNCILEIPQNIKYTLEDGVLTIKAGTIITVPYGTTDQSATYPVGATFLNNNFKVVKTYFTNNKFFVQAEVQADISISSTSDTAGTKRLVYIVLSVNGISIIGRNLSTTSEDTYTGYSFNYRTDLNLVQRKLNTGITSDVTALPIMAVTASETSGFAIINRVFNGMGYIGSTFWADGITLLLSSGLNADGTKNNTQFVPSMAMFTVSAGSRTNNAMIIDSANGMVDGSIAYRPDLGFGEYDSSVTFTIRGDNYIVTATSASAQPKRAVLGRISYADNLITDFAPFSTISVADDGNVLHKTGNETAYGDKTFNGSIIINAHTNTQPIQIITDSNAMQSVCGFNTQVDYTALPSTVNGARVISYDKNGQYYGFFQTVVDSGILRTQIGARRQVDGADKGATVEVAIDQNGYMYGTAPTYTANYADSSTKIVTTAYMANHWVTGRATTTSSASKARPAVVIQNYVSGTSWYRVWSDGWIEQGGVVTINGADQNGTVTLLKAHANTNYSAIATLRSEFDVTRDAGVGAIPSTTNQLIIRNGVNFAVNICWRTAGY